MNETRRFTTIVRTQRRITLPGDFEPGDIVAVEVRRIAEELNATSK
jgi:hypothetical protein